MKIVRIGIISLTLLVLVLGGCSSGNQSPTPTPLKELTATEFFDKISPSIAYINTSSGSGSGFLIEGGYVVTCAHVVWPFENISVAFPNGSKFQAHVLNYDLMADIAILEPLLTNISPLMHTSQPNLSIGAPVFAIGYPGENENHILPTLSQGMISTLRSWSTLNMTFIQTDAATDFGQSGGGLFSNKGELLGMLGYHYSNNFALAISCTDLLSRVERLITGEDVAGLGSRQVPFYGGGKEQSAFVGLLIGENTFVIRQPKDTEIEIEANSKEPFSLFLFDISGDPVDYGISNTRGIASVSTTAESDAPYFLRIIQYNPDEIQISGNCDLIQLDDTDDGNYLHIGETTLGSLDYRGDVDYYSINLLEDDKISFTVDSLMIDPILYIFPDNFRSLSNTELEKSTLSDDDSGGGLFGEDAYIEFTAPKDGFYIICISDSNRNGIGGYTITVEW